MSDFREYLDQQLKNEEFKKEWNNSECEYILERKHIERFAQSFEKMIQMTVKDAEGIS